MKTARTVLIRWPLALLLLCPTACDNPDEKDPSGEKDTEDKDSGEDEDSKEEKETDSEGTDTEDDATTSGTSTGGDDNDEEEDTGEEPELPPVPKDYEGEKNPKDPSDKDAVAAGKKIFDTDCEGCHGATGEGEFPGTPDMSSKAWGKRPDDYILWRLSEGVGDIMPGYKDTLSREQLWEVITYCRTLSE